jgi:hypothetical protein
MSKKLHEWKCPGCGRTALSRTAPPKPGVFFFKALFCKPCNRPMKPIQ